MKENNLYGIKDAVLCIDGLDSGQIEILNEYLFDSKLADKYIKEESEEETFYPAIAGFLNSTASGKESIRSYASYKMFALIAEMEQEMKEKLS